MTAQSARMILALSLAVAATLTIAPAAIAQPTVATIYHHEQLPTGTGTAAAVTVTCPSGYRAISGTHHPLPAGVWLIRAVPSGAAFNFLFRPSPTGPADVTVVVGCLKITAIVRVRGKAVKLKVKVKQNVAAQTVNVTNGVRYRVVRRCPSGMAPVGTNVDTSPVTSERAIQPRSRIARIGGASSLAVADAFGGPIVSDLPATQTTVPIRFIESMPQRGEWDSLVWPDGDGTVTHSVNCAGREMTGLLTQKELRIRRRIRRALKVVRRTKKEPVGAASERILVNGCPSGGVPLASVYSLPDPVGLPTFDQVVFGAAPDRDTNATKMLIMNLSPSAPVEVVHGSLCMTAAWRRIGTPGEF